jgi:catechol 2,3-dioxygenase-like lactoylglutathione lyase family enzyme
MAVRRLTHLGICVSDLDRSLAFYTGVLDFAEVGRFQDTHGHSSQFLELDDVRLTAVYLERDGWRIELLHYEQPPAVGTADRRPMNQIGFTHLSFVVADLDATLAAVGRAGGRVIEATRMQGQSRAVFATDPDGVRLELIERDGDPLLIPGQRPSR